MLLLISSTGGSSISVTVGRTAFSSSTSIASSGTRLGDYVLTTSRNILENRTAIVTSSRGVRSSIVPSWVNYGDSTVPSSFCSLPFVSLNLPNSGTKVGP